MRERCGHVCHNGGYECDPCWRLHSLVERTAEMLDLAKRASNDAADRHPSIRSSMRMVASEVETLSAQFDLMVKMGDTYSATVTPAFERAGFPLSS